MVIFFAARLSEYQFAVQVQVQFSLFSLSVVLVGYVREFVLVFLVSFGFVGFSEDLSRYFVGLIGLFRRGTFWWWYYQYRSKYVFRWRRFLAFGDKFFFGDAVQFVLRLVGESEYFRVDRYFDLALIAVRRCYYDGES